MGQARVGTVGVGTVGTRAMLAAFAVLGLDSRRIQAEAGFSDEELADPDVLLPADRFYRMWEAADRLWGRPALGLLTGCNVPFGAYEVLDYLLTTSGTVGGGLEEFSRYMAIATQTARYQMVAEPDGMACEMAWQIPPAGVMFHLRDYSLSVVSRRVAYASGCQPLRVELHGPPLASAREYTREFRARTVVRTPRNALIYSREAWEQPLRRSDADLNRTLRRHADLLLRRFSLPERGSTEDLVRRELLAMPHAGAASLETVARRLSMSPRTLQRRLRESGTSFEAVSRQLLSGLAQEYLRDPGLTIGEVAYLLGFSELSAFSRAFRRWTGQSPHDFRASSIRGGER